ncbi:hypothetical protein ILYODFUR_022344 [Ilyodon furcidens]|uniref:Uncharacterized protein n=1 Tax=Ilyodon furcidens TaxID=33524 RepID=A0ABV0VG51_9TELE
MNKLSNQKKETRICGRLWAWQSLENKIGPTGGQKDVEEEGRCPSPMQKGGNRRWEWRNKLGRETES